MHARRRDFFCRISNKWRKSQCIHRQCANYMYQDRAGRSSPPVRPTQPPTTMTLEEMREKIGDFKKIDTVEIPKSVIQGELSEIVKSINARAADAGMETFKIVCRTVRRNYNYAEKWMIEGEREYTDDELMKEGPKIIGRIEAEIKTREKARRAKVEKFNRLAAELGAPKIEA